MTLLWGRRQTPTCLNPWKEIQKYQYTSNEHFPNMMHDTSDVLQAGSTAGEALRPAAQQPGWL